MLGKSPTVRIKGDFLKWLPQDDIMLTVNNRKPYYCITRPNCQIHCIVQQCTVNDQRFLKDYMD